MVAIGLAALSVAGVGAFQHGASSTARKTALFSQVADKNDVWDPAPCIYPSSTIAFWEKGGTPQRSVTDRVQIYAWVTPTARHSRLDAGGAGQELEKSLRS